VLNALLQLTALNHCFHFLLNSVLSTTTTTLLLQLADIVLKYSPHLSPSSISAFRPTTIMADEVSIDKNQFHERLSAFIAQWKADKRSGDALFNGAGSISIVMGKSEEAQGYNKSSAMQVRIHKALLGNIRQRKEAQSQHPRHQNPV